MNNTTLISDDPLTQLVRSTGMVHWEELLSYVAKIPYGRTSNKMNFELILKENRGTCSIKHAFLKQVALNNGIENIQLFIGIYKMTEANTPGIGKVLSSNNLEYLPEAHCYLKVDGIRKDVTAVNSDIQKIEPSLLEEIEIQPNQIGTFKVNFHKRFLTKWIEANQIPFNIDAIWQIREKCIENLSH